MWRCSEIFEIFLLLSFDVVSDHVRHEHGHGHLVQVVLVVDFSKHNLGSFVVWVVGTPLSVVGPEAVSVSSESVSGVCPGRNPDTTSTPEP